MLTEATDEGVGIADEVQLGEKKTGVTWFFVYPRSMWVFPKLGVPQNGW